MTKKDGVEYRGHVSSDKHKVRVEYKGSKKHSVVTNTKTVQHGAISTVTNTKTVLSTEAISTVTNTKTVFSIVAKSAVTKTVLSTRVMGAM